MASKPFVPSNFWQFNIDMLSKEFTKGRLTKNVRNPMKDFMVAKLFRHKQGLKPLPDGELPRGSCLWQMDMDDLKREIYQRLQKVKEKLQSQPETTNDGERKLMTPENFWKLVDSVKNVTFGGDLLVAFMVEYEYTGWWSPTGFTIIDFERIWNNIPATLPECERLHAVDSEPETGELTLPELSNHAENAGTREPAQLHIPDHAGISQNLPRTAFPTSDEHYADLESPVTSFSTSFSTGAPSVPSVPKRPSVPFQNLNMNRQTPVSTEKSADLAQETKPKDSIDFSHANRPITATPLDFSYLNKLSAPSRQSSLKRSAEPSVDHVEHPAKTVKLESDSYGEGGHLQPRAFLRQFGFDKARITIYCGKKGKETKLSFPLATFAAKSNLIRDQIASNSVDPCSEDVALRCDNINVEHVARVLQFIQCGQTNFRMPNDTPNETLVCMIKFANLVHDWQIDSAHLYAAGQINNLLIAHPDAFTAQILRVSCRKYQGCFTGSCAISRFLMRFGANLCLVGVEEFKTEQKTLLGFAEVVAQVGMDIMKTVTNNDDGRRSWEDPEIGRKFVVKN